MQKIWIYSQNVQSYFTINVVCVFIDYDHMCSLIVQSVTVMSMCLKISQNGMSPDPYITLTNMRHNMACLQTHTLH